MERFERNIVAAAATLGIFLLISATVGGYTFYRVKTLDNTLTVTGSASQEVRADSAKWTLWINRYATESEVPTVQARVSRDIATVHEFFTQGGIAETDTDISPVSVDVDWSKDQNQPRAYTVRQQITVSAKDPDLIAKLSRDIGSLSAKGLIISSNSPEYYISTLPDIRVALIGKAIQDAKARAESIAGSSGQRVGALKSASSGVVQVMAPQSVDIADYGSYDTSTIDKTVMVTARAVFYLR